MRDGRDETSGRGRRDEKYPLATSDPCTLEPCGLLGIHGCVSVAAKTERQTGRGGGGDGSHRGRARGWWERWEVGRGACVGVITTGARLSDASVFANAKAAQGVGGLATLGRRELASEQG
jgi:hypothetical protein